MEATLNQEQRRAQKPELPQRLVMRVGLVDRVALRVGVALVAWGRRPRAVESHEARAHRLQQELSTRERQLAAERMHYLSTPQR